MKNKRNRLFVVSSSSSSFHILNATHTTTNTHSHIYFFFFLNIYEWRSNYRRRRHRRRRRLRLRRRIRLELCQPYLDSTRTTTNNLFFFSYLRNTHIRIVIVFLCGNYIYLLLSLSFFQGAYVHQRAYHQKNLFFHLLLLPLQVFFCPWI